MAQARRARRVSQPSPNAVLLAGSHSFEQRVTVEWETSLGLDAFDGLLAPILAEPRAFDEIRAYVSGTQKEGDPTLPPGRVSKYLVSGRSLREALAVMVEAEWLALTEEPVSRVQQWSRRRP